MTTKLFVLILVATLCGCKGNKEKPECIAVLIDLTDSLSSVTDFNMSKIKGLFKLNKDLNSSGYCIIASIGDIRYNTFCVRTIESQNSFEANEIERAKLRDSFFNSIHQDILKIKSEAKGRKSSFICYAIANTIEKLNGCGDCGKKKIIILSDLMENSDVFSVYNKQQWTLMIKKPEELYPILDNEYPIRMTQGIEIIIKHQPVSTQDDEKFHNVFRFFQKYYELKGIQISIENSSL